MRWVGCVHKDIIKEKEKDLNLINCARVSVANVGQVVLSCVSIGLSGKLLSVCQCVEGM